MNPIQILIADDHATVDLTQYTMAVWTNGAEIFAGPAGVPHGAPAAQRFTNWASQQYEAAGIPAVHTITIANTSGTSDIDWLAVDWIELHLRMK